MTINFNDVSGKTVSPYKLAHVVLRTADKNAMTKFYIDFLGASITFKNEAFSFLTYDDEHHRIAIAQYPGLNDKDWNRTGLEHVAFTYKTLEELFLSYRQRKAKGILPFWCINHGLTISIYYYDPDGNVLETQWDTFEGPEEANDFIMGEEFAKNPIGADFDPEEFIKRIENGEPEASLKVRQDVGARGLNTVPLLTKEQIALASRA